MHVVLIVGNKTNQYKKFADIKQENSLHKNSLNAIQKTKKEAVWWRIMYLVLLINTGLWAMPAARAIQGCADAPVQSWQVIGHQIIH
jgi:hypothetical protein